MLRKPVTHDLPIAKSYFRLVKEGKKNSEIRFDDRDFLTGDIINLNEFFNKKLTGESIQKRIAFILRKFEGLRNGYVILELEDIKESKK